MVSSRAYQLRVPNSSPGTRCPLFFGNTAKWPKDHSHAAITQSSMGLQSYMHNELPLAA